MKEHLILLPVTIRDCRLTKIHLVNKENIFGAIVGNNLCHTRAALFACQGDSVQADAGSSCLRVHIHIPSDQKRKQQQINYDRSSLYKFESVL